MHTKPKTLIVRIALTYAHTTQGDNMHTNKKIEILSNIRHRDFKALTIETRKEFAKMLLSDEFYKNCNVHDIVNFYEQFGENPYGFPTDHLEYCWVSFGLKIPADLWEFGDRVKTANGSWEFVERQHPNW